MQQVHHSKVIMNNYLVKINLRKLYKNIWSKNKSDDLILLLVINKLSSNSKFEIV